MQTLPALEVFLWRLQLALQVLLFARLFQLKLAKRYPALTWNYAIHSLRSIVLMQIPVYTDFYAYTYMATQPLLLACFVWVTLEIASQVLEKYKGLSIVSRQSIIVVLALSTIAALWISLPGLNAGSQFTYIYRSLLVVEATVSLAVFFFLTVLAAFLLWYPVLVRKNLLLYSLCLSVYFASQALGLLIRTFGVDQWARPGSMIRLSIHCGLLVAMTVFFKQSWETESRSTLAPPDDERRQRLLGQIERINTVLEARRR